VIIHGFDGIFFPERPPMNDFFVVHSDDIAPAFFVRFFADFIFAFLHSLDVVV
jgi:hypothetical protein